MKNQTAHEKEIVAAVDRAWRKRLGLAPRIIGKRQIKRPSKSRAK